MNDNVKLGRAGKVAGEGFYHYNDTTPEFLKEDFLADTPDISIEDYGTKTGDEDKDKAIALYTIVASSIIYGGLELFVKDAAEFEDIDRVWEIAFEVEFGPFKLLKQIDTDKVYKVLSQYFNSINNDPEKELHDNILKALKENNF